MAEFVAGEVVVPVVPDASGVIKSLRRQLVPAAVKVGQEMNRGIASQMRPISVPVSADTSRARAEIQQLARDAQRASGQQVRVSATADTASASAALAVLEALLGRVDGRRADVSADADTAGAQAALAALEVALSGLDGRTANVRVDADVAGALAGIGAVAGALVALPAAAAIGLGAGGLAGAAVTAGLGLGALAAVAGPALGRINESLKAQEAAAKAAGGGLAVAAGATRNLAVEQAKAQIATLQAANAAETLRSAQDRVKDAVAGVSDAQGRLKQAVQAAAQAQVAAAARVATAERSLASAQQSAVKAQESLNRARQQAIKDLAGIARSLKTNALDQREAALDIADAEQELQAARKGGNAEDISRAEIAYERAKIRAEELTAEQERLNTEQAKGVEGNDRVVSAKEAVESANQRVLDQEKALAQAYIDAGKAGEDAAKRVSDAEKALADARDRVDDAKRAAEGVKRQQKIAALQEKIRKEQAKDQARQAVSSAKPAGGPALSPAEQAAATSIKAFQKSYESFQKDLGSSVLPVITGGLKVIEGLFKPLTPLIKGTSGALVGLEKDAQKALGGKFWTSFFDDLSKQAPTAVSGLGKAFGSVLTGVAGIIKAFLPFVPTVVGGIQKAAAAFATWGKGLGESQGFKSFIEYAKENGPKLLTVIKSVAAAGMNLIRALAPIGGAALTGLAGLASTIAAMDPQLLQAIVLGIGGLAAGIKVASTAMGIFNTVFRANPIGLVITAIGLLVAGLVFAYQNSETFRNIVDAAFKAIGVVATWLWENVLQPAFTGLVALWQNVLAPAVTWLWQTILKPAFEGIGAAIKFAWENIVKPAFTALHGFIVNTLGPKILWFHETIVKPVFTKVGEAIKFAWTNIIQPAFTAVRDFIVNTLGPKFLWFHETIVKPIMTKVGEAISFAWEKVIKPAFSALWTFITETIPNGFKKGVELIGKFWDGLKQVASKPVEFVVNTIYNNGIRAVWNAVAKALGLSELPELQFKGMAKGGILPGTSSYRNGDDQLVAMRRGEGVYVSEAMRNPYERARLAAVNSAAMRGQSLAPYQGLAGGGIVGDILAKGVRIGAEKLLNPMLAQASSMMGDSPFAKMLVGVPQKLVADVIKFLEGKEAALGGPGAAKAIEFARAQIGKDYVFGATGPSTFDCSGLTMRAWQAGGRSDIPRTSQQQMGWVRQVAKPVPGALGFPNPGHVWMYVNPNTIIEAPQTGLKVRQVAARAAQVVGVPPTQYDSGGYLPTGHSLVYNGTGSPEPVLTGKQWDTLQGGAQGGDGYNGPLVENMYTTPEQSPQAIARELYWLSKGRPR